MQTSNSDRELSSQPSITHLTQNPPSSFQTHNYQPQLDEDLHHLPSEQPHRVTLKDKFWAFISKICGEKAASIVVLLILFLSIIDLVVLFQASYDYVHQTDATLEIKNSLSMPLHFMSQNLKADPIMEVQIMEKGSICPSDFEILKLGTWPGTVPGCLCDSGDLYNSTCSHVTAQKCEKDIAKMIPIDMYEWDDSIWCVKRAVHRTDYLRGAECPEGFTECYPGGCFLKDCPITHVEINSQGESVFKKSQGEPPLINIQLSFGDIPCFTQDLFAQTIKNSSYDLSAIKQNNCDKYGLNNQFSARLASQTAYNSFIQNSFPYSVMHLPSFEENANSTLAVLSSIVRMKTAKNDYCLNIDKNSSDKLIDACLGGFSFGCSVFLIFMRLFQIVMIFCATSPFFSTEFFEDISFFSFFLLFTHLASYFAVVPLLIWLNNSSQAFMILKEYFGGFDSLGCFEGGQGGMVISDFVEIIRTVETRFGVYLIFLGSSIMSSFIHVWLIFIKKMSDRDITMF